MDNETKTCKYCKEQIPKKAKRCPKCGGKLGMPTIVKVVIIIAIIIGCIIGCASSCANAAEEVINETKNAYADKNGKTSFKLSETFENKYEKITMTEINLNFKDYSKYVAPAKGNKVILVKFEVENTGEKDEIYVSSLSFNGYADGTAVDKFIFTSDSYKDISATIGKGKKAVGYVAYEVPSNVEKFTIEYNADFWSDGNQIEFVVK